MTALPNRTLRSLVDPNRFAQRREPSIIMDEIPRRYEPNLRKLPHYPERTPPYMPLPDIHDFPGSVYDFPRRPGEGGTYEECQRNQDPGVMHFMDPCQGRPHGGFKLPDLDRMPSFPGGSQTMKPPGLPETLGNVAGMFLGEFLKRKFG